MTSAETRGAVLEVLVDAGCGLPAHEIVRRLQAADLLPAISDGAAVITHIADLHELRLIFRDDAVRSTGTHRCKWRATDAGRDVVAGARAAA